MLKVRSLRKFTVLMVLMMLMNMMFAVPQVSAAGTVYHVATQAQFDAIKDSTFAAGDQILLARGATFTGPLTPHGSGTASAPIIIGAEGTGALPIIKMGAVTSTTSISAIYMLNVSGYQVSNIEVVGNYSSSTDSRGIWMKNTVDNTTQSYFRILNCTIHDIGGAKSNGITIDTYTTVSGACLNRKINDVVIDGCTIYHALNWGMWLCSNYDQKVFTQNSTGLTVKNCHIYNTACQLAVEGFSDVILENNIMSDTTAGTYGRVNA